MTFTPSTPNYFYQPTPGGPLLPSPQMQSFADMIFEPLRARQNLNSAALGHPGRQERRLAHDRPGLLQRPQVSRPVCRRHRCRSERPQTGRRRSHDLSRDLVSASRSIGPATCSPTSSSKPSPHAKIGVVASADLTQVLRLDPRAVVEPLENDHLQITLIDPSRSLDDLIPIGLTNRPELAKHQALVQATLVAIRREKLRPLLPSVLFNGFTTPYELLQATAYGEGSGGKMNLWS